MARCLITGFRGMVGTALKDNFGEHQLILTDKEEMDVTDYDKVMSYLTLPIDFIIHLAAETDLEICEKNPAHAYFTNQTGTRNMVELATHFDIPILYMSTAGIFDGTKNRPYSYYDQPNPINHYGRSKLYGEYEVRGYQKNYVVRASWMIGGGPNVDKKFVNKIIKKIKRGDKEIKVVDDCIGSPTYTVDLVKSLKYIIDKRYPFGVYHCAGIGSASRYEVAKEIVNMVNKETNVKVIPVKSEDVRSEFPCNRSKNEVLINNHMPLMVDWRLSLKDYINDFFKY